MGEYQEGERKRGWLLIFSSLLVWITYGMNEKALVFLPFTLIFPTLYFFRKFLGYFVILIWYIFLWILFFTSILSYDSCGVIPSVLLLISVYIYGYILYCVGEFVRNTHYSPDELLSERLHAFSIGAFLSILSIFLGFITLPVSSSLENAIFSYFVLLTLVSSAAIYGILNFLLKIRRLNSLLIKDTALLFFSLGLLIMPVAYMMGYTMNNIYYSKIPLLIYSYILASMGGAYTMIALQGET